MNTTYGEELEKFTTDKESESEVNIVGNPTRRCGFKVETQYHYFFECHLYSLLRQKLVNDLAWLPGNLLINLEILYMDMRIYPTNKTYYY